MASIHVQHNQPDATSDTTIEAGPPPFPQTFQPTPQYSCCQHVCQRSCQHPKFESVPLYETNPPDSTTNAGDHTEDPPKDAAVAKRNRKRAEGAVALLFGFVAGMCIIYYLASAAAHKKQEQEEAQLAE